MVGYKLVRKRKDGSYGPLFIGQSIRWDTHVTYEAEDIPTKGFAHRPGFHVTERPYAPHLKQGPDTNRVWVKVLAMDCTPWHRPESQGGTWYTCDYMQIIGEVDE
jgi:hypothetical protein